MQTSTFQTKVGVINAGCSPVREWQWKLCASLRSGTAGNKCLLQWQMNSIELHYRYFLGYLLRRMASACTLVLSPLCWSSMVINWLWTYFCLLAQGALPSAACSTRTEGITRLISQQNVRLTLYGRRAHHQQKSCPFVLHQPSYRHHQSCTFSVEIKKKYAQLIVINSVLKSVHKGFNCSE